MNYSPEEVEKRLKELVLESISLQTEFKDAQKLVDNSTFMDILKEDPDFIGHYPPEYWAEYILAERKMFDNWNE